MIVRSPSARATAVIVDAQPGPTTGGARMVPGMIPRPVVTVLATMVILVWATAQVAVIFVPDYEPPAEIHVALMVVLTALFGLRKDNGKDDEPKPETEPEQPTALPEGRISAADLIARLQADSRSADATRPRRRDRP